MIFEIRLAPSAVEMGDAMTFPNNRMELMSYFLVQLPAKEKMPMQAGKSICEGFPQNNMKLDTGDNIDDGRCRHYFTATKTIVVHFFRSGLCVLVASFLVAQTHACA